MSFEGKVRLMPGWWHRLDVDGRIVVLLASISLVRGVLYALLNPHMGSPDEIAHYLYVSSLFQTGQVEGAESHQPPLYYWVALLPYALVASEPPAIGLLAMRLVSVVMTSATVLLAYLTARAICPRDRLVCLGTAAFVATVPAFGWIGASANNDNLAKLAASGMVYLLVWGLAAGFTRRRSLGLLGLVAVGLGSKATTWPVIAVAAVTLIARAMSEALGRRPGAALPATIILLLAATGAIAGLLHSMAVGRVRILGIDGNFLSGERLARFVAQLDPWPFVYQFKTFWVTFWSDTIQPPSPVYWLLAALCLASVAGLGVRVARVAADALGGSAYAASARTLLSQATVMGAAVVLQWFLSLAYFYRAKPLDPLQRPAGFDEAFWALQGRFLFPVMIPIGFLFVWGLGALLPKRWAEGATLALIALLLAVDWIALGVLYVGYYSWPR